MPFSLGDRPARRRGRRPIAPGRPAGACIDSPGPDAARATWKLNGTLRITTKDKNNRGSINGA